MLNSGRSRWLCVPKKNKSISWAFGRFFLSCQLLFQINRRAEEIIIILFEHMHYENISDWVEHERNSLIVAATVNEMSKDNSDTKNGSNTYGVFYLHEDLYNKVRKHRRKNQNQIISKLLERAITIYMRYNESLRSYHIRDKPIWLGDLGRVFETGFVRRLDRVY